jgi:anaerobic magnesium-protoporphyrin IX monomethyl ester cyclase
LSSRILMISTSQELSPQPAVPIGAAWVAQALHLAGFETGMLDLCFEKEPLRAIGNALDDFQPDGIGISVRNLDNCDFLAPRSFLPDLKHCTDLIKSRSDARILLGGAGVSIMPQEMLEYLALDNAVVGEGEAAAVSFFRCNNDEDAALIPGVVRRGGGEAPAQEPCATPKSEWVKPRTHWWTESSRYLRLEPVLPIQGKRGCANRCLYCTYRRIEGEAWRLREPADIVEEMLEGMHATGAREFEFIDSVFNEPEGYLELLMEEIIRREVGARLRVSSLSPKGLTRGQLKLMEEAGMDSLVITPESASDLTLGTLRKDFGEEDVNRAAELLGESNIRALWCFLLGAPEEDGSSLGKSINFINTRMAAKDAAFITTGIRIYPGTGLHAVALREGVVEASSDLLMPAFYFSRRISPEQARNKLLNEVRDLSRCIFLSDTRQQSMSGWRRIGTALGIPSPFWRYAGYMNRLAGKSRIIRRNWGGGPADKP